VKHFEGVNSTHWEIILMWSLPWKLVQANNLVFDIAWEVTNDQYKFKIFVYVKQYMYTLNQ
jgi:hypothetical protein